MSDSSTYKTDRDADATKTIYTTSNGAPFPHPHLAQRAGSNGPLLLQDFHLIDLLAHFDRERIPERVVHAKGGGAHGTWECTEGLEDLCVADVFKKGTKCPVTMRFSTVGGESGSNDNARDPRGFTCKFRTAEGNWDFVGNNTPIFFLRDPAKFPTFIHTQKRDPATHLGGGDDATNFWDYLSQNPESVHQVVYLFGDRGIPLGWRYMNGYSSHTFKLINKDSKWVYTQIHFMSDQGEKNQTDPKERAERSPDFSIKDLYEAIDRKEYPSWTVKVQTMTAEQAEKAWKDKGINVFDLTHIWPHKDYPLRTVGKVTLNENPKNYFAEIEQAAFSPSHLVPGLEASFDPVLQSRLFSYPDTHRHRLGTNYQQLPVNQSKPGYHAANFQRDGPMAFYNQGSRPNYLSTIEPVQFKTPKVDINKTHEKFISDCISWLSTIREEDFQFPRNLYCNVFNDEQKKRFISEVSQHMSTVRDKEIIARQIAIFREVSPDLAKGLEEGTGVKGGPDIRTVTFNGSNNAMDPKKPLAANNFQHPDWIVYTNGAPE